MRKATCEDRTVYGRSDQSRAERAHSMCQAASLSCALAPSLQRLGTLSLNLVHVGQEFRPRHNAGCFVRGVYIVRASALLRIGAHLLAHLHADVSKLVLHCCPALL